MQLNSKLSLDSIRDESGTRTNFIRGADYYKKHRVAGVRIWRLPDREDVEADVRGSGDSEYKTRISISNLGEIKDYDCTCPAYRKYGNACKHIVALLLYRFHNKDSHSYRMMSDKPPYSGSQNADSPFADDSDREEPAMIVKNTIERTLAQYDRLRDTGKTAAVNTDYRIQSLIDCFVTDDIVRTSVNGDVKAVTKLELYEGTAFLNLTVGRTRQYVVKNMESFCNDIKTCGRTAYGKELELVHHIESFEEEIRPSDPFYSAQAG